MTPADPTGPVPSTTPEGPPIDPGRFRSVLGHLPTAVTIVTAHTDEGPVGMVIGTAVSVSLDPPLVGFLPARSSSSWPAIEATGHFCVNVLGVHHEELTRRFSSRDPERFTTTEWHEGPTGAPVLTDAAAWIDCRLEQVVPSGDHLFVLGRVLDLDTQTEHEPLIFHRGGFRRLVIDG